MLLYAVSDLHLHCDEQPSLFTSAKEAIFSCLIDEVVSVGGTLAIVGDCIDFTGMENPPRGHREFFEEIFGPSFLEHPEIVETLAPMDRQAQLRLTRERFPDFFAGLGRLARAGKLVMVPGNHDCALRDPAMQRAFESEIGADAGSVRWERELVIGELVRLRHGNDFDSANRTKSGCLNPGAVFTMALYQALMPALSVLGVPRDIVDMIPAVRPEEVVVRGIELFLGERDTQRLIKALVRLIARNGYFRGPKRLLMIPLLHRLPVLSAQLEKRLTPEAFALALRDDGHMKDLVRHEAHALRLLSVPRTRFIVFGHTHVLDHSPHYMNLGTWIDHIGGISLEHLKNVDNSLPVLRVDTRGEGEVSLHDARDLKAAKSIKACRRIY